MVTNRDSLICIERYFCFITTGSLIKTLNILMSQSLRILNTAWDRSSQSLVTNHCI